MAYDDDRPSAGSVATLVARILRLPITALVFGMEMVVATLHGLQRITDEGLEAIAGDTAVPRDRTRDAQPSASSPYADRRAREPAATPTPATPTPVPPAHPDEHATANRQKEQPAMPDTNLNDDMLKLVRYKILFVRRDYEVAFPEQEELVYDNITDTAFVAWKIAEFIQRLDRTLIPPKWTDKQYPNHEKAAPDRAKDAWKNEKNKGQPLNIHWLPEGDKKFLRVYFEVMARYTREKFRHDEREVEVLEQIRDAIKAKDDGKAPAPAPKP